MASLTPVCDVCNPSPANETAVVWCSECDKRLCIDCDLHHGLSQETRIHTTSPITEHYSLPHNTSEIKEYCEEHNQRYRLFCKQHDCPCCKLCAVNRHSKCTDMEAIEKVIQNIKISTTFYETESLIDEILEIIDKIHQNRTDNLFSVTQQIKKAENEISALRTKLNTHLDQIQETLLKELAEVETTTQTQTTSILGSLDMQEKQLNGYQATMSSIKSYASDLQSFLSMHRIERDVTCSNDVITKIMQEMKNTTVSFQTDNSIQEFPAKFSALGKVTVKNDLCELNISREKNKQAQVMVPNQPSRFIGTITLNPPEVICSQGRRITGCVLLPDDKMLFSCYHHGRVRSVHRDSSLGAFDTGVLHVCTFDITNINDTNSIAVTCGANPGQCIRIMDMETGRIMKTFPVNSDCDGIVYRDNTLIYCARSKGLRMINLDDGSISDISVEPMSRFAYVATYENKLYYTNNEADTVTCCDLHGNIIWQFKDESILKFPRGISVDSDGNVYVVGQSFCNIVVISSDGKYGRHLLGEEDGFDWLGVPHVLHYEKSTNELLVASNQDAAFLFQVVRT